jgi:hypothetical protein
MDAYGAQNSPPENNIFGDLAGICKTRIQQQQQQQPNSERHTRTVNLPLLPAETTWTHMEPRIRHPKTTFLATSQESAKQESSSSSSGSRIRNVILVP